LGYLSLDHCDTEIPVTWYYITEHIQTSGNSGNIERSYAK